MSSLPEAMPALITPFDPAGNLDIGAHRDNVESLAGHGVTGLVLAGSTGEGPYLEPGERAALVDTARRAVPRMTLLCGVNAETNRAAFDQIAEAADSGADAALVITPTTLVRGRDHAIEHFYGTVADEGRLPIYLYIVPLVTGYALPLDVIARLSALPRVAGLKDSSGDPDRITELATRVDESFVMYVGASRAVLDAVRGGAYGAITASANYCWQLNTELVSAAKAGDAEAGAMQRKLWDLTAAIEPMGLPATKAAAGLSGLRPGRPRRPLQQLDAEAVARVSAALAEAGLPSETVL